jgi:hypothetical protein
MSHYSTLCVASLYRNSSFFASSISNKSLEVCGACQCLIDSVSEIAGRDFDMLHRRVQLADTELFCLFLLVSTVGNDLLNGWPVVLVPSFYSYSQSIFCALHTFDDFDSSERV